MRKLVSWGWSWLLLQQVRGCLPQGHSWDGAVCPAASSSLGAQGAWQGCHTSRECCPEMTFLNFQAFCCHWDKFLLEGLWGHIREQVRGWGLPVPASWGPVGTLPARAPGLSKSQEWGWRRLVTPGLAHVPQQQRLPAGDTISFSSVPGPCGSLSVPFGTDSSVPLDKPAAVKGQRKKLKWPLYCRLMLRPLGFDCTVCDPAHLFSWYTCAYFQYAYLVFLQK